MTDAELIVEARKAAPLYGNDWGVLLTRLADRLEQIRATTFSECADPAEMKKRRHIGLEVKLAAALLAIGDIPYEDAKQMTARDIVALYNFDHYPILHAIDPIDEPWNLVPRLIKPHRAKSAKDVGIIAKVKRLKAAADLHAARRIASPIVTDELVKLETNRKWPKRKIQNRPWQKVQRSFPKRHKRGE
jgi:hypothetical protein